jgi:hypothetical protein
MITDRRKARQRDAILHEAVSDRPLQLNLNNLSF